MHGIHSRIDAICGGKYVCVVGDILYVVEGMTFVVVHMVIMVEYMVYV